MRRALACDAFADQTAGNLLRAVLPMLFIAAIERWRRFVTKSMTDAEQLTTENIAAYLAQFGVTNGLLYDTIISAMKRILSIEKVALYARVSTKDGRQETENQLGQLREYAAKQGWEIVGEYVDHETGGTSKRPHFQRMFADARTRKFDLVLFWSLDRLSREGVSATLAHLERLTAAGVNWRSYTEEYLDSTGLFKDAVIAILAVIAKQERIRRSERASAAIARLRRQGKMEHIGRRKIVFDRARACRMHADGIPLRAIADELGVSAMTVLRAVNAA